MPYISSRHMRLYHWIVWPRPPATPHLAPRERQPVCEAWLHDLSQNGTFVNRKLARTYMLCIGRAQAVRVPCIHVRGRMWPVRARAPVHVHVVACGMWHVACGMCICAYVHVLHAWLQVGVGKHQRLHDGDLVEVFNRDLLRHRTVSPTPHPPLTHPSPKP